MSHNISLKISTLASISRVRRTVRFLLIATMCFLVVAVTSGAQYNLLPVYPPYSGPSGEPGQIQLNGIVTLIMLMHAHIEDESDWHVYIDLDTATSNNVRSQILRQYDFVRSDECRASPNCNLDMIYSELMGCDL